MPSDVCDYQGDGKQLKRMGIVFAQGLAALKQESNY